jgi:hypothetical protein
MSANDSKVSSAAETPLKQVSMQFAQGAILEHMFYRFQGSRPDLEPRLRAAYKARFGTEMMNRLDSDAIHAFYLEGMPGHGKTTAHREAAREFSKLMGMRFIEQVSLDMVASSQIGRNDFVFTIIELAGETSSKETGGLVTKMKAGGKEFLGHLPDWRLAATMMGGYGYVLFDDFATATHQVQNSMLGLLLNGSVGDLSLSDLTASKMKMDDKGALNVEIDSEASARVARGASPVQIGLAGNRGVRDGNKVFPITTATSTRVHRWDVVDQISAFCGRSMENRSDKIGEMNVSGFLQANRDFFTRLAESEAGMLGQSAVPRTWDMFLTSARFIGNRFGGLMEMAHIGKDEDRVNQVLSVIKPFAGASLGKETGARLTDYYRMNMQVAGPLALRAMSGQDVADDVKKRSSSEFNYAFAGMLSECCASNLAKILQADGKASAKASAKSIGELSDPSSDTSVKVSKVLKDFATAVSFLPSTISLLGEGTPAMYAAERLVYRLRHFAPGMLDEGSKLTAESSALLKGALSGYRQDPSEQMKALTKSVLQAHGVWETEAEKKGPSKSMQPTT